jgi:VanZ family protein
MAAIFAGSSLPHVPRPPAGFTDKDVHLVIYAGLAAVLVRALAGGSWRGLTLRRALGAAIIATMYGVLDEFHQRLVPGRSFEIMDMAADAAGAALAAGALWTWGIIRPRNPSGTPYAL